MNHKWPLLSKNSKFINEINHTHQKKSPFHSKISAIMAVGKKCLKGIDEEIGNSYLVWFSEEAIVIQRRGSTLETFRISMED